MATKEKLRKSILDKIQRLSEDKLPDLNAFISDLEKKLTTEKPVLSFSGIFKELDLSELTDDLHQWRDDNDDRIPKF